MTLRLILVANAPTHATTVAAFPLDEPILPARRAEIAALAGSIGRVDRACSSPARARCRDRGCAGLAAEPEPALRDLDLGRWAGQTLETVSEADPAGLQVWTTSTVRAPHGGESIDLLLERVASWMDRMQAGRGRVVAVTHAAVIRAGDDQRAPGRPAVVLADRRGAALGVGAPRHGRALVGVLPEPRGAGGGLGRHHPELTALAAVAGAGVAAARAALRSARRLSTEARRLSTAARRRRRIDDAAPEGIVDRGTRASRARAGAPRPRGLLRWAAGGGMRRRSASALRRAASGARMVERYYEGPVSDHYDGELFFNPGLPRPQPMRRRTVAGFMLRRLLRREPIAWPSAVPVVPARPEARVDALRITGVGHSTLLIQAGGRNVLTDPVWSQRASPFRFAGPRRVTAPGIAFADLAADRCRADQPLPLRPSRSRHAEAAARP